MKSAFTGCSLPVILIIPMHSDLIWIFTSMVIFLLPDRKVEIFTLVLNHHHNNSYLCRMIRKTILFLFVLVLFTDLCNSQALVTTADLFKRTDETGSLNIIQSRGIDTLITRYILYNKKQRTAEGQGMPGYRIQIYRSSVRNAREESSRANAEFINRFPAIRSYTQYQEPGYLDRKSVV